MNEDVFQIIETMIEGPEPIEQSNLRDNLMLSDSSDDSDFGSSSSDDNTYVSNKSSSSDDEKTLAKRSKTVTRRKNIVIEESDSDQDSQLSQESSLVNSASNGFNSVGKKRKLRQSEKERRAEREKRKLCRNAGLEYTTKTGKTKKRRELRDLKNCRMKCKDRLPLDLRKKLFDTYWSLGSYEKRSEYIARCIEINKKKTTKSKISTLSSKKLRTVTFRYYVYVSDLTKQPICKDCFLKTFDESQRYLQTICEKLRNNGHLPPRVRRNGCKMSDQSEVDTTEADRLLLDCRVCLLEKPVSLMSWDIFTPWTEKGLTAGATIASELSELAKIDIQDVEGYPRYICKSCLEKLVSAIELVGDVKKSEKILTQKKQKGKLSPEQKWPKPIELDKSLNEEVLRNSMDVDVKQEMISDEEIGETGMDDDRQDNLSLLDIKLEPEDITEHPAIQVTVNDSRTAGVLISEDSESDPLKEARDIIKISNQEFQYRSRCIPRKTNFQSRGNSGFNVCIKNDFNSPFMTKCNIEGRGKRAEENTEITKLINLKNQKQLLVCLDRIDGNNSVSSNIQNDFNESEKTDCKPATLHIPESRCKLKTPKVKALRDLRPPCTCQHKCSAKISPEQRLCIWNYYWSLGSIEQRAFVLKFTKKHEIKGEKKNFSFTYYLPVTPDDIHTAASTIRVCVKMFKNTVSSIENVQRIWKMYESGKLMVDGRGQYRRKVETDAILSVCDHFERLQNDKLRKLGNRSSKRPLEVLSFDKMYKLYKIWVLTTNYTKIVRSLKEYKNVIIKNIPSDHIQSLQQGLTTKYIVSKQENTTTNQGDSSEHSFLLLKNENREELGGSSSNSLGGNNKIDQVKNENLNNEASPFIVERTKQSPKWKDSSESVYNSNEEFCDSYISNISDEFRQKLKEENGSHIQICKKKLDKIKNSDSDSISESSDEDFDIENIKLSVKPKKCLRNDSNLKIEKLQVETANTDSILTKKLQKPTRDIGVIRKYCKYHGLAYETENGNIIPKKVIGPPCSCNKECATKIPEGQRQIIFNRFWSLGSKSKQILFVKNCIEKTYTATYTPDANKNRDYVFTYFLPTTNNFDSAAEKVKVCRKMFINTNACSQTIIETAIRSILKEELMKKETNSPATIGDTQQFESIRPGIKQGNSAKKQRRLDQDNTTIDFVYRAMPFEEYMSHFAATENKNEELRLNGVCFHDDKHIERKMYKREVLKQKISLGKRHLNKKGQIVGEKIIGPPCACPKLCFEKLTEKQRQFLFNYYWTLGSYAKRSAFIVRFSTRKVPNRRTRVTEKSKPREYHYSYYLPISQDFDGEKIMVCLKMFSNTFAVAKTCARRAWIKYEQGQFIDARGQQHGKKTNAAMVTSVRDYLLLLQSQDPGLSSFRVKRKNFPNGGAYNPQKIYKHYSEWFDPSLYSAKVDTYGHFKYIWYYVLKMTSY